MAPRLSPAAIEGGDWKRRMIEGDFIFIFIFIFKKKREKPEKEREREREGDGSLMRANRIVSRGPNKCLPLLGLSFP
jgi:hypothetical protein